MIPVCELRNAGLFDNLMVFDDDYMNNFSLKVRGILIQELRCILCKMTPEQYLNRYCAQSIFPYGVLVMLIRRYKDKLTDLKQKYGH
uniref:Uncharacterized protein n=1 Tax=viral metagenome TaxID=1070528 RepID=A0A6C0J6X3_9ZZZZ